MKVDGKRLGKLLPIPVVLALLALFTAYVFTQDATPTSLPSDATATAAATFSPSTPGSMPPSTTPRDVSQFGLFSGPGGAAYDTDYVSPSTEDVLEKGLYAAGASPTHIAIRGMADESSIRCDWRGSARTLAQRGQEIRFWLGKDDDVLLPSPAQVETEFMSYLSGVSPQYLEYVKALYMPLARGGLSVDRLTLTCFADYTVSEYLLGAGPLSPNKLSVAYDRIDEVSSYELYRREHDAGRFGDEPLQTRGEYESSLLELVSITEVSLADLIGNRESVVFLAPMGAHNAIAVEAWQVVEQWDLQTDDDDVVHAVRYGVPEGDPEYTQTLANLKSRVTTASTTDDFADDRIENASGLTQYYRDIGAYGDITPDDGQTATFTPSLPPAALTCADGTAVTNPGTNRGLVHDCEALLDNEVTLAGTASLNWSADTAIASWDGVTTSGTPSRVTELDLSSESLTGSIPGELGNLFELTLLDLSSNSLTGDIPSELGWLYNLTEIRLSGNSLTGCIPIALEDVATNDLSSLNLLYCQPPVPGAPTAGTVGMTSTPLSWTAVSNTSKYRVEYREAGAFGWTVDDETLTGTTHTVDGLLCETEYLFRVSAYGSGTTYAAAWSDPSSIKSETTGMCVPPVFGATSYSFNVVGDAALDVVVGTVSATDAGSSAVTYAITAGNDDSLFAVGESSGDITVAADLRGEAGTTVTLIVAARKDIGGEATVPVMITITETCDSGTAMPSPSSNAGLVSDCKTLLGLQSVLAGTATLNWSASTAMTSWDGVTVGGTPSRVTVLDLEIRELTGSVPPELSELTGLEELLLGQNRLTGGIPKELGSLTNLNWLYLRYNQLTGPIPPELGDLSNLTRLFLHSNQLTGSIPPEIGDLTELEFLWLSRNQLTGVVPWQFGTLTNLGDLSIAYNQLEGCVPPALRRVRHNDLDEMSLLDCLREGGTLAPTGVSASLTDDTFTIMWNAVSGAANYEAQHTTNAADAATVTWTALAETTGTTQDYTPADGVTCSTAYRFRVRAFGDGDTYTAMWGTESDAETVETASCPPVFGETSYAFDVAEDAEVDDVVGTVSATDPDEDDEVSYAITAGNTGNAFDIDDETGDITVAVALDHETAATYSLTVEADDGNDQKDTVTVSISVTDVPEDAPPVPTPVGASLTDSTFTITWEAVTGASKYEVQYMLRDSGEDWAALEATTTTTSTYSPADGPPCGSTYEFRVRAYGDAVTFAALWSDPSEPTPVETESCIQPPAFDQSSYAFLVSEDATTVGAVGTVSATDPDSGDTLTYSIISGNEDGKFTIDGTTGEITVEGALDRETADTYTLTVEVDDGNGETATVTVTIAVVEAVCSGGIAVPDPANNTGLVSDCETLLGLKDQLAGTARLNWSTGTAMSSWDGVTIGGTPKRVNRLTLGSRRLTGSIPVGLRGLTGLALLQLGSNDLTGVVPPELGELSNMQSLRLHNNRLSGAIPWQMGNLTGLSILQLSGNLLEGCVPPALEDVVNNDFDELGLPFCTQAGPVPAPEGLSASLAEDAFSIAWTAVTGAGSYEVQYRVEGSGEEWAVADTAEETTLAYIPADGVQCETTYDFRVRAYGDGTTYVPGWGQESAVESVTTDPCNRPPAFDQAPYAFEVAEDAEAVVEVGAVSATDPDGDALTYRITGGNGERRFGMNPSAGTLSLVAGPLDYETTDEYTLMIRVDDRKGGTDTATVIIRVTDVGEDAPPAPENLSVTLAEGAFTLTWTALRGATRYEAEWRAGSPPGMWSALATTTETSQTYTPERGLACGAIYQFQVRAYGDGATYAAAWGRESATALVTTEPCNLAPAFDQEEYAFSVAEDAGLGVTVGSVTATDRDPGDTVGYVITGGNEAFHFAVDQVTGAITVRGPLDYETTPFYRLRVVAIDPEGQADTAVVEITVIDVGG